MSRQRSNKPGKPMTQPQLMALLRGEIARAGKPITSRAIAPTVFALADAAKRARGRTVIFRGFKFLVVRGFWPTVCDATGEVLFSVGSR